MERKVVTVNNILAIFDTLIASHQFIGTYLPGFSRTESESTHVVGNSEKNFTCGLRSVPFHSDSDARKRYRGGLGVCGVAAWTHGSSSRERW